MPSCYDRVSCSVSEDGQVLTINTKNGTCTFTRGDDVTFTETEVGYIITINGEPYIIPKIEPGDDVDFTEDEGCYIITINNVPHCIPKCRYYRDCEGNILDACERIVTCDDLESRGYIACFDEDDFVITPTDVDGELVNCLSIAWGNICAEAVTVDEIPDNANVLFCNPNGTIGKGPLPELDLTACIEGNIPNIGELCGEPEYLVLIGQGGDCPRIGRYSPGGAARSQGLFRDAQPNFPDDEIFILPDDFSDPTAIYRFDEIQDAVDNGTVDESIIANTMITRNSFVLDCSTRLKATTFLNINQPADVAEAYSQRLRIGFRWRVDGGPWEYEMQAGRFSTGVPINALESGQQWSHRGLTGSVYPAGNIETQAFYVLQTGTPPGVRINANTFAAGDPTTPVSTPRTQFTPAL